MEEWYSRAGSSTCSSSSPQQVAQMPSASRKRSKCSSRAKKKQRWKLHHLKECLVGGLELCEVWGSQKSEYILIWPQRHRNKSQANTTPFNFIQLSPKGGGGIGFPSSRAGGREKYSKRGERLNFMEYFHWVVLSLMVKHHFFSPWLIKKWTHPTSLAPEYKPNRN